jgi:hypothetical protein
MAEIEKTEFEFPDEKEVELKTGGEVEAQPEIQIEVVDDTPEADRGRKPMTEPPREFAEDELTKYDESVQKRIKHFTKGYHEERRAKEAALREREEAVRFAQSMVDENKRLKGSVNQNQSALLEQAKKVVNNEIEDAKRRYREAYDSGDSDKLVEAQEALTTAKIRADKVNNFKPTPLQVDQTPVQVPQESQQLPPHDEKLTAWLDRNRWYGSNKRVTSFALGVHEELVDEGIPVGSDEYYRRIDADVRELFPNVVGGSGDAKSQRAKSNNVASATRSTAPRKIVLSPSQISLAKRLGVPLELYAKKVAEEMRK